MFGVAAAQEVAASSFLPPYSSSVPNPGAPPYAGLPRYQDISWRRKALLTGWSEMLDEMMSLEDQEEAAVQDAWSPTPVEAGHTKRHPSRRRREQAVAAAGTTTTTATTTGREGAAVTPAVGHVAAPDQFPMDGMHMRVGVVEDPPLMMKGVGKDGKVKYTGILVDVLRQHSTEMGFTYELMEAPDRIRGTKQKNGTWTGIMGSFQRGDADLLYVSMSVTAERSELVQFSQPFLQSGMRIVLPKSALQADTDWFILRPFKPSLWLALLGLVLGIACIFHAIDTVSPYGKRQENAPNWLYHALGGGLLNIDAFRTINHHGVASSILTLAWTFAALATVTLYTANMMSFLTVAKLKAPVTSPGDLATLKLRTGMLAQTFNVDWVRTHYPAVAPLIRGYPSGPEALDAIRRGEIDAAILRVGVAEYFTRTAPCDMVLAGPIFATSYIAVGMPKNAGFFNAYNSVILEGVQSGDVDKVNNDWLVDHCAGKDDDADSLGLHDVRGVFIIIAIGVCMALTLLFYQVVRYRITLRRLGELMVKKPIDDLELLRLISTYGSAGGQDANPTIPVRHAKLVLKKHLGASRVEIAVLMAAVDFNGDGFLDIMDLERLQSVLKKAKEAADKHYNPYSLNAAKWNLERLDSFQWNQRSGAFTLSSAPSKRWNISRRFISTPDDLDEADVESKGSADEPKEERPPKRGL